MGSLAYIDKNKNKKMHIYFATPQFWIPSKSTT